MSLSIIHAKVLFNKQRYEFFSKSQLYPVDKALDIGCCSISKDTNFSANHNPIDPATGVRMVLFNKQRYEFFSKSQPLRGDGCMFIWCCSISKDTNFSANHNSFSDTTHSDYGVVQ